MAAIRSEQSHPIKTATEARWLLVTGVGVGEFLSGSALGYVLLTHGMTSVTIALIACTYLLALSLPLAIYRDYRTLKQSGLGWDANLARYVAGAMIGVSLYLVSIGVATVYLIQRYRRVSAL